MGYAGSSEEVYRLPGEEFLGKPLPSDFATMAGAKVLAPVAKIRVTAASELDKIKRPNDLTGLRELWQAGVFGGVDEQTGDPGDAETMFAWFIEQMTKGVVVLKYPSAKAGSRTVAGAPKKKLMRIDENVSTLEWTTQKLGNRGKRYGLLLCEVMRVVPAGGKQGGGGGEGRRLSLLLPTRRLDIEAGSTDEYELLLWGFGQILKRRLL